MTAARGALLVTWLLGLAAPSTAQQAEPLPVGQRDDGAVEALSAEAIAPSLAAVRGWARSLGAAEARGRRTAIAQLRGLGHESLPVMRTRLRELAEAGVPSRSLAQALAELRRRALGPRAARRGDATDRLAAALDDDATEAMRAAVELTSLTDALIAQHTLTAAELLVDGLLRIAPRALRAEATRARKQLGPLLAPSLVEAAADPAHAGLRQLARAELAALQMPTAQHAFERIPTELLPALLRAYGSVPSAEALPNLVAHVGDPRSAVHEAAAFATERFGDRALPLLRLRVRGLLRATPRDDLDAAALLRRVSEQRIIADEEVAMEAVDAAESALTAGRLDDAWRVLDRAPPQQPDSAVALRIARAYFALGTRRLDAGDRNSALRAFRRVLRKSPPAELGSAARARVLALEAEQRRAAGIADLHALDQAALLDPSLIRAAALRDALHGTRSAAARARRRHAAMAAAALFAIAALLLYRDAKQRRQLRDAHSPAALR